MELQRFSNRSPEEDILSALEQDGGCILEELISPDLCDALMNDFAPYIDAAEWSNSVDGDSNDEFFGYQTKRFHGLVSMSPKCADIIEHPLLLSLANRFLGRGTHCRALRISTMELMVLGQGQARQALHRDNDSWMYLPRSLKKHLLFSANIALCDFTPTNGATVVVPGSHLWPDERSAADGESCLAVMKKGSALLYSGEVVHGGGNNTESNNRTGFYIGYIPSWLSGLENHAVINQPGVIDGLGQRVRHLLDVTESAFEVVP